MQIRICLYYSLTVIRLWNVTFTLKQVCAKTEVLTSAAFVRSTPNAHAYHVRDDCSSENILSLVKSHSTPFEFIQSLYVIHMDITVLVLFSASTFAASSDFLSWWKQTTNSFDTNGNGRNYLMFRLAFKINTSGS